MTQPRKVTPKAGYDPAFLQTWFRFEKAAWIFMGIVLALALAGLLGRGPLAQKTTQAGGLKVKYESVARYRTPASIEIDIPAGLHPAGGEVRVYLEGGLVQHARIQSMLPQSGSVSPLPDGLQVRFPAADLPAGGSLFLSQEPSRPGIVHSRVALADGPSVDLVQIVLP